MINRPFDHFETQLQCEEAFLELQQGSMDAVNVRAELERETPIGEQLDGSNDDLNFD